MLPKLGKLEFDFLYFLNRPNSVAEETKNFDKVIEWFENQVKKVNPHLEKP